MANFDPYHQWLGIPPAEQPPDHYRLLGILQFEDDPTVIENAADRQMAHLKTFQTGPRSADSQRLLNEVAAARVCLLSPDKKEAYDQQLRQVSPQDDAAEPEIILDTTLPSSRKSRGNSLLIAAGLGAVTLVVVVLAAIFFTADENKPELPGNDKSLAVAEPLATEPAATEPTAINPAATSESKQPGEPLDISSLPPGAVFTDKPDADQPSSDTRDDDTKSDSVQKPPAAREDLSKMATDWGDSDKDDLAKDKSDPESPKPQPSELESQDDELTDPAAPGSMMDSEPDQDSQPDTPQPDTPQPDTPQPKQKLTVPTPARQKEIVKRMEGAYDFSAAKTPSAQRALARRLFRDGLASRDSRGEPFVLLNRSAELSAGAVDVEGMFKAVDAISTRYEIAPSELALKLLKRFVAAAKTPADILDLRQACRQRIDEHLAAARCQEALDTAKAVYQAVSRLRNKNLRKQMLAWQQALAKLQKDHQAFTQAQRKLADTPENANAAFTVGSWYCFGRDDYPQGLPFLAKGSDSALATVAKRELEPASKARTPSPGEQVALGDAWWKLAEKAKGSDAVDYRLRALHWYSLAKPRLSGLSKATASKRLDEYAQLAYKPHSTKSLAGLLARLDAAKGGSARIKKRQTIKWMAHVRCDDSFEMCVNGKPVFNGNDSFSPHQSRFDMAPGDIITVRVKNTAGPRGFCCVIRSEKGHTFVSGPAWKVYQPNNPDEWADPTQIGKTTKPSSGNNELGNLILKDTRVKAKAIWGRGETCYLMLEVK